MSDYEPFDDRLADALRSRAGSGATSVAAAHEAVLARAGQIRRRRAGAIGGIAMIALSVGGVALLPRDGGGTLAPGDTGDVLPSVEDDTPTTGDNEPVGTTLGSSIADGEHAGLQDDAPFDTIDDSTSSTTSVDAVPGTVDTSATGTSVGTGTASSLVSGTTPTSVTPTVTANGGTSGTSGTDSTTSSSEVDAPQIAPFTKTYSSLGGSITVSWNGSSFSLLAVAPAVGFEQEIEDNEPLRIRVRFRSDDAGSRIEVRVSDGLLVESTS